MNALQKLWKITDGPVLILPIVGLFIALATCSVTVTLLNTCLPRPSFHTEYRPANRQICGIGTGESGANLRRGYSCWPATRDKGYAALIGLVTFIVFINAMNITLQLQDKLAAPEQMKAAGQSMVLGVQVLRWGLRRDPYRCAFRPSLQ